MRFKLRPIGNSIGIILPQSLIKKYHLNIGDDLLVNDTDDSIILTAANSPVKYKLRDLVAKSQQSDLSEEDKEWLNMKDLGEEVIWE